MGGFLYNRRGMLKVQHLKEVIRMAEDDKLKSKVYPPTRSEIIFKRVSTLIIGASTIYLTTKLFISSSFSFEFKLQYLKFVIITTTFMTLVGVITEQYEKNKEKRK